MMKNVLNLYYFCIYFKKRPKNDLVLFRFVLYTPQGLKTYQSCRRSFQVNSFRVLADSVRDKIERGIELNRSPKGNIWSAIPVALLCMNVNWSERKQGSGPKEDKVL